MNEKTLELLYRFFDGELTPQEKALLDKAVATSEELRVEKRRIHAMRQAVSGTAIDSFRPFFAERVMQRISARRKPQESSESFFAALTYAFRRVALAGTMVIAAFIIYNVVAANDISLTTVFGAPEVSIEEVFEIPLEPILEDLS